MSLENNISKVIQEQLQGDLIEKVVAEKLEDCVRSAVDDLFGHWGECKKIVEEKIKEVMIPQLEKYDYSKHIVKLDTVLTEILKSTSLDNKKILKNFESYFTEEVPEEIKMSEIFEKFIKNVEKNVKTDGLEVEFDDGPHYESVEVRFEVQEDDGRSWSDYRSGTIYFECEHDEKMNFEIKVMNRKNENHWWITNDIEIKLASLKNTNEFELFMMMLRQNYTHIVMDTMDDTDEAYPEAEPEADFR